VAPTIFRRSPRPTVSVVVERRVLVTCCEWKKEDLFILCVQYKYLFYSNWQLPMGENVPWWLRCLFGECFLALYDTCSLTRTGGAQCAPYQYFNKDLIKFARKQQHIFAFMSIISTSQGSITFLHSRASQPRCLSGKWRLKFTAHPITNHNY
jgi:hypothetical protein